MARKAPEIEDTTLVWPLGVFHPSTTNYQRKQGRETNDKCQSVPPASLLVKPTNNAPTWDPPTTGVKGPPLTIADRFALRTKLASTTNSLEKSIRSPIQIKK